MRLGDLDALKNTLFKTEGITWDSWKTIEKVIDNAPTIEPTFGVFKEVCCGECEKRPKGEWITGGKDVTGQYFYDEFICNQCFTVVTDKSNFCPKCGADMRKKEGEDK